MVIRRVYVEKRGGFDEKARSLAEELKHSEVAPGLTSLRILNRYDVQGLSEEQWKLAIRFVLSEPNQDWISEENIVAPEGAMVFGVEYLPGQFDQRADSAAQCIQILTEEEKPVVRSARVYVLEGLAPEIWPEVRQYLINPVDSREASLEKPVSLDDVCQMPQKVLSVSGFLNMSREDLGRYREEQSMAMSLEDLTFCQTYFRDQEREPTVTELKVIDTYWSDHCRHTTFMTILDQVSYADEDSRSLVGPAYARYLETRQALYGDTPKDLCLMDMAVIGAKEMKHKGLLDNLDESDEINACSIEVEAEVNGRREPWLVMFKNETHNHPTEIEPFGGAATCLGGAIRDPLSGRSYVYGAMRVTGSGDPRQPIRDTLPGKLPQRQITTEAAHGYSSYGNQIGLATGQVAEHYHPGFVAKRMEVGAVVGAAPKAHVFRARPEPGDQIILVGGRTGRDGCGGATGSSKEHDETSILTCGAEVQKGNPPTERKIQRLFRNPECARLIKKCNDFGAGGVCVAVGELTESLTIHLDRIPRKYEGLDGTELAISESQERMAVVVAPGDVDRFLDLAAEENLEATFIADVTDSERLVMEWNGQKIVNIHRSFLDTHGILQHTRAEVQGGSYIPYQEKNPVMNTMNWKKCWLEMLGDINVCSQKGMGERFDGSIGNATVLMPYGGKYQATASEGLAMKLPVMEGDTDTATVMTYGYDPDLAQSSPYLGAMQAVVSSVVKAVCLGADYRNLRLSFQEYFGKPGTDPRKWGDPVAALLGALEAQKGLGLAAIGGKDSMSGTFQELDVPPTLISFACGPARASQILSPELKTVGSVLHYVPCPRHQDGSVDFSGLCYNLRAIQKVREEGRIRSAGSVGGGGLVETLSRMAFGNRLGLEIEIDLSTLTVPDPGGIVLELKGAGESLPGVALGRVLQEQVIRIGGEELFLGEAYRHWMAPLESVFPLQPKELPPPAMQISWNETSGVAPKVGVAQPRICIPVFPGTNCEYDSARAFTKAGGDPQTLIFCNETPQDLEESVDRLAQAIRSAQILMLPGGFSAGDEPEGSGKFIAAALRSPRIREAVTDLLENRDGLILGICNGFQALMKVGLLPGGTIRDLGEEDPTLTFNTLGRHISGYVNTRVSSVLSPWLQEVELGDLHRVAISHGEGRFMASEEVLKGLIAHGQIATQYVDHLGMVSHRHPFNPNGSVMAVEGITSQDGRIFGKMGHSERVGPSVASNIPGEKDQRIFRSGVRYFSL